MSSNGSDHVEEEEEAAASVATSLEESESARSGDGEEGSSEISPHVFSSTGRESLRNQMTRNSFLQEEVEKLLDDLDRFEWKLEDAENEIDRLLLEKKKLQLKLDNAAIRRDEVEVLEMELDEARDRIVNQQQIMDEQEQYIEEQDDIIRGFEEDFKRSEIAVNKEREQRISKGRVSQFNLSAKKQMQMASLQAQLEFGEKRKSGGNSFMFINDDSTKDEKSDKNKHKHKHKDEVLENEREEYTTSIAAMQDKIEELKKKVKKAENTNTHLALEASKCHEWKQRAEIAERNLADSQTANGGNRMSSLADIAENGDNDDSDGDWNGDDSLRSESSSKNHIAFEAPQALLLQGAVSRSKQKNNNAWNPLSLFGGSSSNINNNRNNNSSSSSPSTIAGFLARSTSGGSTGRTSTPPADRGMEKYENMVGFTSHSSIQSSDHDDSDVSAVLQINKTLKDANKELRKDVNRIEKAHKKEQAFNQKLILKLQKENEKLSRKLDVKSVHEKLSPDGKTTSSDPKTKNCKSSKSKSPKTSPKTSPKSSPKSSSPHRRLRESIGIKGLLPSRSHRESIGIQPMDLRIDHGSQTDLPPGAEGGGSSSMGMKAAAPSPPDLKLYETR